MHTTLRATPNRGGTQTAAPTLRAWRLLATAAAVAMAWLLTAGPAQAEDPFSLPEELVDHAGVVEDEAAVRAAQDELFDETGKQLWVVYVDDFSGMSGPDWAEQTAILSHLGPDDLLLAVAVQERSFADSVDSEAGFSDAQLDRIVSDRIEPALRDDDWDGAAIAAAEGFQHEDSAGSRTVLWLVGGVAVLGAGVLGVRRYRTWSRARTAREEREATLEETAQRVGSELVALDTALNAAEGELQYAEAEFSPELTAPFREALATSREESLEAYRLREQIAQMDAEQDHAGVMERYQSLEKLVTEAGERLDEHATAFNDLRRLADRAPERVTELTSALERAAVRLDEVAGVLSGRQDLPAGQRERLDGVVAQSRELLSEGAGQVEQARQQVVAGSPEDSVGHLKAAEQSLSTITEQTDGLADLDQLVAQWRQLLSEAAASLRQDVEDADRLAPQDHGVQAAAAPAREALGRVSSQAEDPVDLAEELADIERGLDAALAGHREAEERHRKAVQHATRQMTRTRSRIETMDSELRSARSLATSNALANAQRAREQFATGQALLDSDPTQADVQLREAGNLAGSVLTSLRSARPRRSATGSSNSGWGGSWWGGAGTGYAVGRSRSRSSSRRRSSSRSSSSRRSSSRSSRRSGGGRRSSRGGRF